MAFSMFQTISNKIRQQVKDAYGAIAHPFDQTRKESWPEFEGFSTFIRHHSKVLDLGCGNGRLYSFLKTLDIDYLGVDNSSALLERARANFPEASFQLGDMVHLELPDRCFDTVLSIASFHHIPSRRLRLQCLHEIHRVLKDDGILILTSWNLFQWKYLSRWVASIASFIFHFGFKYAWNDLWIPWSGFTLKRYYHAFLPRELLSHFSPSEWVVEDFYFSRKGSRVKFWKSFNLCLIARKRTKIAD